MLERTEQYLLHLRDGEGGFKPSAKDPVVDAWIVWALAESGSEPEAQARNLDKELAALREQCKTRKDPYLLALAGLSHLARKHTREGVVLMQRVREFQRETGLVSGAQGGITGPDCRDLDVETTALAVLGWLKADRPAEFDTSLLSAAKWLGQQRRGAGSYGGTQATVLALKAMVAHQQKNPRAIQGGEALISVSQVQPRQGQANAFVRNQPMPAQEPATNRASFSSRSQDPLTVVLPNVNALRPGKNVIQLNVTANNALPYTLTWAYRTQKPANDPKAPVKLSAKLNQTEAKEGEMVKLTAIFENVSGKRQGMAVAILGLPAGVFVPDEAANERTLAALHATGKISAWEVRGRELVLYMRDLAPDARIEIELDLLCRSPGEYRGPASRAYLSYDADRKFWIEPLNIRIIETP
jgi:alpha-2-macroglobulin-like protein